MAFDKLQIAVRSPSSKGPPLPASMSLSSRISGPAVKVSLTPAFAKEGGIVAKSRFDVMIGTDDDAGKLRIIAAKGGSIASHIVEKSGGLGFYLGVVPAIGMSPHKRLRTDARVIEPGCVEIDIPQFSFPKLLPTPAKKVEAPALAENPAPVNKPAAPMKRTAGTADTVNGVAIDLTQDSETVSFKGSSIEVTTRQAKMVRLLARPRPAPVATSFLIGALWDGKPTQNAQKQIEQMVADLQAPLKGIGLDLKLVKGVGYQLKDA
jgi:hypothetical protein